MVSLLSMPSFIVLLYYWSCTESLFINEFTKALLAVAQGLEEQRVNEIVYDVDVVDRIPIYGYHSTPVRFIKITIVKPKLVLSLAACLYRGEVLGYELQPYEVHIPYLIHFLSDCHLSGSSVLYLSRIYIRNPLPSYPAYTRPPSFYWKKRFCSQQPLVMRLNFSFVEPGFPVVYTSGTVSPRYDMRKTTECELEADTRLVDILNPFMDQAEQAVETPGWAPPVKLVLSMKSLWEDEKQRCLSKGLDMPSVEPLCGSSSENNWSAGEELDAELKALMTECAAAVRGGRNSTTDTRDVKTEKGQDTITDSVRVSSTETRKSVEEEMTLAMEYNDRDGPLWVEAPTLQEEEADASAADGQTIEISDPSEAEESPDSRSLRTVAQGPHSDNTLSNIVDVSRGDFDDYLHFCNTPYYSNPRDIPAKFETRALSDSQRRKVGENTSVDSLSHNTLYISTHQHHHHKQSPTLAATLAFRLAPPVCVEARDNLEEDISALSATAVPRIDTYGRVVLTANKSPLPTMERGCKSNCEDVVKSSIGSHKSSALAEVPSYGTLLMVEVLTECKGHQSCQWPNSASDKVLAIAYLLRDQRLELAARQNMSAKYRDAEGVIFVGNWHLNVSDVDDYRVSSEVELFDRFMELIIQFDPTIILGYDTVRMSIGYLLRRSFVIGLYERFVQVLSRSRSLHTSPLPPRSIADTHSWLGFVGIDEAYPCDMSRCPGRMVINASRLFMSETKMASYTLENMSLHVLALTVPCYTISCLAQWWNHTWHRQLCLRYILTRCSVCLKILDKLDILDRAIEMSVLFGCDVGSLTNRGSQFRVESMLIRAAHSKGFLLLSPTRAQVTGQGATMCAPLVLEPKSSFYWWPVLVLDFRSLYPSIIIAHNICYSTCLGTIRVHPVTQNVKSIGTAEVHIPPELLVHVEASGGAKVMANECMFVKPQVRRGILPALLDEIIATRVMVKRAMKSHKEDENIVRAMQHRQFGLKMIANVSYGYTGASFSGRMPCADVADAIVQTARSTLERAMQTVEQNPVWNAEVVYGDTDSLFVLLKGRNVHEAFEIGQEIADAVTQQNPPPMELILEKVYLPCCLVSKKRYVGMAYSSSEDRHPVFDAKGIETIRRDQCAATSKIMEGGLRVLFETKDLSALKDYLYKQWLDIASGDIPLQDFIFYREARLGTYKAERGGPESSLPPQARIALAMEPLNPNNKITRGERVAFLFAEGHSRLTDAAAGTDEVQGSAKPHTPFPQAPCSLLLPSAAELPLPSLHFSTSTVPRLDYHHYIRKQILPALNRLLCLIGGVDLNLWYDQMPKPINSQTQQNKHRNVAGLSYYYTGSTCIVCGKTCCASDGPESGVTKKLSGFDRLRRLFNERSYDNPMDIPDVEDIGSGGARKIVCESCMLHPDVVALMLLRKQSTAECALSKLHRLCIHCTGSAAAASSCHSALHCQVYYKKLLEANRLVVADNWMTTLCLRDSNRHQISSSQSTLPDLCSPLARPNRRPASNPWSMSVPRSSGTGSAKGFT
eukprot:GHVQ01025574.1.p1 GENE.GHVQ01025574.1~~GHVQ01025574.1.p1  ORF type:complete len:1520 (-),score=168.75 GHVQ01025574.1:2620-7179(-)